MDLCNLVTSVILQPLILFLKILHGYKGFKVTQGYIHPLAISTLSHVYSNQGIGYSLRTFLAQFGLVSDVFSMKDEIKAMARKIALMLAATFNSNISASYQNHG